MTAQTETVLHNFGSYGDGLKPLAGLTIDKLGNLWGTTSQGGDFGGGTVFQVTPSGVEEVWYSFGGTPGDGNTPLAGLAIDPAGNLYGTTEYGGANLHGTVYEVSGYLTETVLYSFGSLGDGVEPFAGLTRDTKGSLYGTTFGGGAASCFCGTVFMVTPTGSETVLHSFSNSPDGSEPFAGLEANGGFYGTTAQGGSGTACSGGCGTIFNVTGNGKEKVLYSFKGDPDGSSPRGGLIRDKHGNLYGTTLYGGAYGKGTIFRITSTGVETVLYNFTGQADGGNPTGALVMDSAGNLYGVTGGGGDASCACGVVFKLGPSGAELVLHSFGVGTDGQYPNGIVMDKKGNLYGTTYLGGTLSYGTVFKLAP
jgi:uncharacterized repeat protein (TIGR03803 family)